MMDFNILDFGDEFNSKLSQTFNVLGSIAFLAFPFLLVTTLFIYLFTKKEKNHKEEKHSK